MRHVDSAFPHNEGMNVKIECTDLATVTSRCSESYQALIIKCVKRVLPLRTRLLWSVYFPYAHVSWVSYCTQSSCSSIAHTSRSIIKTQLVEQTVQPARPWITACQYPLFLQSNRRLAQPPPIRPIKTGMDEAIEIVFHKFDAFIVTVIIYVL